VGEKEEKREGKRREKGSEVLFKKKRGGRGEGLQMTNSFIFSVKGRRKRGGRRGERGNPCVLQGGARYSRLEARPGRRKKEGEEVHKIPLQETKKEKNSASPRLEQTSPQKGEQEAVEKGGQKKKRRGGGWAVHLFSLRGKKKKSSCRYPPPEEKAKKGDEKKGDSINSFIWPGVKRRKETAAPANSSES